MAQLPIIKKILKEDLKTAPAWIDALLYPLNTFMEGTYYALDKQLTIADNVNGNFSTITFITKGTYGTASPLTDGWEVQKITTSLIDKASTVLVGQVICLSDYKPITSPVYVDWSWLNGQVLINYMTGLTAGQKYSVTFLIF